ncbi:hypothetical protein BS47DRAFT_1293683, partial [Hydnum rufescens UP504]
PLQQFSRISYCPPSQISSWTCGQPCSALPDFIPYLVGGDIGITPYYYVGYWPAENTAVIVHQGRPPYYLASLLKNFEVPLTPLDITLFPGLGSSIKVHSGFASVQALTAKAILAAVNKTLSDHSISKVTIVGHSLGGAIGMIDMVYLRLHLPSSTSFKFVGHGIPRVGNQAFADYVDSTFFDVTRINYAGDPIPIVPGLFLGYHHVSGEVHILKNNTWIACQDNPNIECSTGDVPTLLSANPLDHLGPYNGIWVSCFFFFFFLFVLRVCRRAAAAHTTLL